MRGLFGRSAVLVVVLAGIAGPAVAQDGAARRVPRGWSIGQVRVEGGQTRPPRRPERGAVLAAGERPLTVRRTPDVGPGDTDDPLYSGGTHYDNIRVFNPFPSLDSGTQLPYGLDGIGGFGSDIGFSAGANASSYFRGP